MASDARTQTVSLGCGTLILIALIVIFFSGRNNDVVHDVSTLRKEMIDLKKAVEMQTREIRALREKLEK